MAMRKTKENPLVRISRAEIEALVWRLTGWRGDPSHVDRLLRAIDEYATGWGAVLPGITYDEQQPVKKPIPSKRKKLELVKPAIAAPRKIRCNHCGEFFLPAELISDNRRPDGRRTTCHTCGRDKISAKPEFARQRVYSDTPQSAVKPAPPPSQAKLKPKTHMQRLYRCHDCKKDFPYSGMRKDSRRPSGVRNRCLGCEKKMVDDRRSAKAI